MFAGFGPPGARPYGDTLDAPGTATTTRTQDITLRFATETFATAPFDRPGNEVVDGRISAGPVVRRRISEGEDGTFGGVILVDLGEVELLNEDEALTPFLDQWRIDGRRATVKIGVAARGVGGVVRRTAYKDLKTVLVARAGQWDPTEGRVRVRLLDKGVTLQVPVQDDEYDGSGGAGGHGEIAGISKPWVLGRAFHVECQLVDPAKLIYQYSLGPDDAVEAVFAGGAPVTAAGVDRADYAALDAAAQPAAGTYETALSAGVLRLGTDPGGFPVTAHVRGDALVEQPHSDDTLFSDGTGYVDPTLGGYKNKTGGLLMRVLGRAAGATAGDVDHATFDALDVAQPAEVGYAIRPGEGRRVEDVLGEMARAVGAAVGPDYLDRYGVARIEAPEQSPAIRLTDDDIIEVEEIRPPYGVPHYKWDIGAGRHWRPLSGGEIAGGLSAADRLSVQREWLHAVRSSTDIIAAHKASRPAPFVPGFFTTRTPGQVEAQRRLDLTGLNVRWYRVLAWRPLFGLDVGSAVHVTSADAGLSRGRSLRVVEVTNELAPLWRIEFLAFG